MEESLINLSLGPPELKAWCERGATGEGKLFLQGHCPYPGSGGKSNNAGQWKLYSPMQSAGPLWTVLDSSRYFNAEGVQVGQCVFTSELQCTARLKPKQCIVSIDSWRMQKPNTSHSEKLFSFQRTKQCAIQAIFIHCFVLTEQDKARPCGTTVERLTPDQMMCVQVMSRSRDFNQDSSLLSETKLMIAQHWCRIAKSWELLTSLT